MFIMDEDFKIERTELKDKDFLDFVKKYDKNMDHLVKSLLMIEPDKTFIKSNMKKLMYYIYKNNKDKGLE